ncbi:protein BTG3 [Salvelinus namaycush]|uniref:Protein BTG3 n=1 Tax=Salvelinus namaycush TaxID=8040 RepID=A0A8U0QMY6_SALNM|nr:protein BTG3 [Salvelinus namaycush]
MMKEIAAVVFFLKRLIKKVERLDTQKVDLFVERLTVALQEKFRGHWYPDNPSKGQAFRCIRVNRLQREDPELLRACQESGVQYKDLGLPRELTLWVDPGEVCCRYGERNLAFTVASFSGDDKEDVTKKVTSAVERVTSDYHSCSSSDEDSGLRETRPPPTFPQNRHKYQVIYPATPLWRPPVPKQKMWPGKGYNGRPRPPHYDFRTQGRPTQPFRHNDWAPPGHRRWHGYWGGTPGLAHC